MTLEREFESVKDVQIDNFCDQLKRGFIQYGNRTFSTGGCTKQVWIITRGLDSREIRTVDDILVKEVSISEIIELYRRRLIEDLGEGEFEKELRSI